MSTPATAEPRISLLYVDDEPALLEIGKIFLEKTGEFAVTTAESAAEAILTLKDQPFDAIISDYQMPGCDGISFLRYLRKIGNKTPFIIFTGKGREDIVIEALNEGADFYIQKGGDPKSQFAELSNKVRYAVTRRKAEERLIESEDRYKNVVETQTEFICRFLPDGTHIFVNQAYCRRFDKKAEDLIGTRFKPVIHPDDAEEVTRLFASLTPDHPVGIIEQRVVLPDNEVVWDRWITRAFFDDDGTLREYQSVGRDITEIMERDSQPQEKNEELAAAEEEMRAAYEQLAATEEEIRSQLDENIAIQRQLALSEERYRAIFEHTEAPTIIIEEDTSISLANSAFAESSGYSKEEVIGRSWTEFVSKADLERMMAYHRQRREEGGEPPEQYEFTFINRYGELRPIHLTVGMIPGTRQSVASFHDLTDVKQAVADLRESEEKYHRIVDTSVEGIWQLDTQFRITYVNRQMAEMLGYTPDEMIGMDAISLIPPDEHVDSKLRRKRLRKGEVDHFERRFIRRDGSSLWTHVAITPIMDADGKYQGSFAIVTDLTDRKRSESEVLEAQRLLEGMLDGIPDIVGLQHPDQTMIRYNKAGYELLGLTPEEVEGRRCYELIGRSTPCENCATALAIASKKQETVEKYIPELGIYLECTSNPILDENGEIEMIIERLHDITDRKAAEEALQKSEDRFSRAIAGTGAGLWDWDMINDRVYFSHQWKSMLGYEDHEIENAFSGWKSLWHPDDAPRIDRALNDYLEGRTKSYEIEHRLRHKDGSWHWILTRGDFQEDAEGRPVRWTGTNIDITDRKAAEEALHTANKKLQLLSSITRHDILNKIMALQAYLDLTMHQIDDPTLSGYLTEAEKAATAIQKQIEFTRIYENLGVHTPTWHPLLPLIEAIDHTRLPIHHDCGEFSVYADPMFEKVLQNLYDNTLRHAEGADCVRIRCEEEEDGGLIITWQDNGPGVPEELKERIFDKSFGRNTGFGLFLSREILAITGITIVETGVYGKGARFEIRVPAGGFSAETIP